jgi:hypothetical protein
MRTIFTSTLLLFCITIFSQIPNPGFESVSSGKPNGWNLGLVYSTYPIRDTSVAHAGSHAAAIYGSVPPALSGAVVQDFPYSSTILPAALMGWYKFYPQLGDSIMFDVEIWKNGAYANTAKSNVFTSAITGTTNVYSQFIIPISYSTYTATTCDSAFISIYPTGNVSAFGYNWAHPNTKALIDDLVWGFTTALPEIDRKNELNIESVYPNPSSGNMHIVYTVSQQTKVNLKIYDLTGKVVMVILDNEYQNPGRYRADVSVSELNESVYLIEFTTSAGSSFRKKLVKGN